MREFARLQKSDRFQEGSRPISNSEIRYGNSFDFRNSSNFGNSFHFGKPERRLNLEIRPISGNHMMKRREAARHVGSRCVRGGKVIVVLFTNCFRRGPNFVCARRLTAASLIVCIFSRAPRARLTVCKVFRALRVSLIVCKKTSR